MNRKRTSRFAAVGVLVVAACSPDRPAAVPTSPEPVAALDRAAASDPTPGTISLEKIGGFAHAGGKTAAEVTAFDEVSKRVFVVNGALGTIDVLDLADPSSPSLITTVSVAQFGGAANSVAASGGIVAVAVQATNKTSPGTIVFYRATTLQPISSVQVGALPDMVTFSPDRRWVLVANEGEPNDAYTIDPEGSVSIIDVSNINRPTVRTAGFTQFNGQAAALRAAGVRIFGPGATVAQDLEPEYVAISADSKTAFVTLQENNAVARVDIASATVQQIMPLGYKNHALAGNKLDASDQDGGVNIRNWPVLGMYQPDAIATYQVNGQTFLVTANEGDARDYPGFKEDSRVRAMTASRPLNATLFPNSLCGNMSCRENSQLGRLTVTTTLGFNAGTNTFDALYAFGARSFSIWTAGGTQTFDSGDDFEQLTKALPQVPFNSDHETSSLDDRSDNKGPEPEGVTVAQLGRKFYAFIVLERVGGIMAYDVTNPYNPHFVTYINTRNGASGDLGPEAIEFISAKHSPSKEPLLVVGHEVSGTTAVYRINLQ